MVLPSNDNEPRANRLSGLRRVGTTAGSGPNGRVLHANGCLRRTRWRHFIVAPLGVKCVARLLYSLGRKERSSTHGDRSHPKWVWHHPLLLAAGGPQSSVQRTPEFPKVLEAAVVDRVAQMNLHLEWRELCLCEADGEIDDLARCDGVILYKRYRRGIE